MSIRESSSVPGSVPQQVTLLNASEDEFGGVKVEMKEHMDINVFATSLKASLSKWREQEKKGIWLMLPRERSNLVDTAVQEGFWYHHAEKAYLMLVYWIPQTDPTLPANASHRVGISALVVNSEGEALVVKEKHGRNKDWKLPTGVVDEGEDICAAAIREVKEETGIETEFAEILSFRQSHKSFYSKSDLNFVCMLKPLSSDIQEQNSEIEAAKWMAVEKFAAQPSMQNSKLMDCIAKICVAKKDNIYNGFSALDTATRGGNRYLYSHPLSGPEQ